MDNEKIVLWALVALLIVGVGTFMFLWANNDKAATDLTDVNAKLDALNAGQIALGAGQGVLDTRISAIEIPAAPVPIIVDGEVVSNPAVSGDYMRSRAEYEEDMSEAEALRLAEESVNLDDRDFRKAVFNALLDFGVDIDDRDDITEVKYETDVDEDEVEFDRFRVYYFVDGDDEETEKAKLYDFTVMVDNLDFDEDFDDAEVNEDYMDNLEVNKVYN